MQFLQPPGWATPKGYANGVAARGTLVFVGGQIGWNAEQRFESDDFIAQTRQNPAQCARRAGLRGCRSRAHGAHDLVHRRPGGIQRPTQRAGRGVPRGDGQTLSPAMTCVQVAALVEAKAKVEIEVTAVLPDAA